MNITNWSIRHSVTIFVFMVILAVTGWKSYQALPREAQPDVTIPYVMVSVPYIGVSPEDMETLVINKLEDELDRLKDVEEIRSTASDGMATIMIEFQAGMDMDTALSNVRERVDLAKPELPADAEDPIITEISFSDFPIMNITLSGELDLMELKRIAELMKDDVNHIKGILDVRVIGGLEREIRVEADTDKLSYYGVSLSEIINAIQVENLNIPGGTIDVGEQSYLVRVPGEFQAVHEIENVVVRETEGKAIFVRDVATVIDGFEKMTSYSRLDQKQSVSVIVTRRAGENIIRITDELKELVAEYEVRYEDSITFTVLDDVSNHIRDQLAELENNILTGLLLVLTVLMIFLGDFKTGVIKFGIAGLAIAAALLISSVTPLSINPWLALVLTLMVLLFFDKHGSLRTSIFVATAIPFSMLISFVVLSMMDITLNIVVLFSLVLALGMLVDNAIVIVENIVRHMTLGKDRVQATMDAVSEIAWPVVGSTATTVGAFVPLLFWPGIMGEFMKFLPLTVSVVLLSSLFVALVINPVLCANFIKVDESIIGTAVDDGLDETRTIPDNLIYSVYRRVLNFSTQTTLGIWATILGSVVAFIGVIVIFAGHNAGLEFFPQTTPERIKVDVVLPEGSNLEASDQIVRKIEAYIAQTDGVKHQSSGVGSGVDNNALSGAGAATANQSRVSIEFEDDFDDPQAVKQYIVDVRRFVDTIPGARFEVEREEMGPPTGAPINLEIEGKDYVVLQELARQAKKIIGGVEGVVDLKSDFEEGRQEINVQVDREQAGKLGISTSSIGTTIRAAINGTKASVFRQDDDEYDVVVRLDERQRSHIEDVRELYVATPDGKRIKLSEIAEIRVQDAYGAIHHVDSERVITVTSDVDEQYNDNAVLLKAKDAIAKDLALPVGYQVSWTGQNKEQEKAQGFLSNAMLAALSIVVLILITQFNSLMQTGIIMFSVLLSLIGVFAMLIVKQDPFVMVMTGVGVISLAGIVVNNGIVFVDYMNQLRDRGMPVKEAVVVAGLVRFRPVMLTALTTILSLLPTVLGISLDAKTFSLHMGGGSVEMWGPMANAVVGGLSVSTLLVLIVIPAMYVAVEQFADWRQRTVARFTGNGGGGGGLAYAGVGNVNGPSGGNDSEGPFTKPIQHMDEQERAGIVDPQTGRSVTERHATVPVSDLEDERRPPNRHTDIMGSIADAQRDDTSIQQSTTKTQGFAPNAGATTSSSDNGTPQGGGQA